MEIRDFPASVLAVHLAHAPRLAPGMGQGLLQSPGRRRLDILGVPRDPRGIVLACGSVVAAALGAAVLVAAGDPIGVGYLAIAIVTYLFAQTRFVPASLWLLISSLGVWSAVSGAPVGWVEAAVAALLAGIAALPVPSEVPVDWGKVAIPQDSTSNVSQPIANGHPSSALADSLEALVESSSAPVPVPARARLQALGQFRFEIAGRDIAPQLEDKAVLAFFFKYLLARYALGDPMARRTAVGDELSAGMDRSNKQERLRKQIYDLQHDVAPQLISIVRSNRNHVWLDLSEVDSDMQRLRELCERVKKEPALVSSQLAAEIEAVLDQTDGQGFLVGFEELEHHVNQGRGAAGEIVSDARLAIAGQRADLIRALAEYHDGVGRPGASIPYLQSGLDGKPEREDLARRLVTAYLKTGQNSRANEVRRQYALNQE